ncbi:MAG: WD40 repeat domain-containing protein, partial [Abitibacteriaceae bacterium]|nr:WD40 repeat domain-containing protein [Abditibacteriaceae bacterium]
NYVTSLAFAPTGHTLAVANWDQQVRLWDVTDATAAEPLLSLVNHAYSVEAVAFSPDGKWLATGGWDKSIKLLETKNFKVVRTLTGPASAVTALAFSADSQTLVSGSGDGDGTVKLWDVNTGEVLHTYNTPLTMPRLEQPDGRSQIASGYTPSTARVWSVAIAPDNQTVACSQGYPGIKVWNAATGAIVKYAGGNGPGTGQIAFSPDGSTLAGGEGSSVNIWDTKNWKLSHYLAGTIMMRAIAYSPDGDTLATGSWDQTIRLWDTHTGDLKKVLQGHTGEVHYLAFSPDGKLLASGSADHTIKLWDTQTWKLARPLNDGKQDNFAALAFSPDSKLLACADSVSHKIQFWDVATNKKLSEAPTMNHQPTISLAFSPDGKTLAEGTSNGFVFIRDVDKALRGEEQSLLEGRAGYTGGISSVAFFPAEVPGRKKLLAVSSFENSGDIRIYSLGENGEHRLHGGQAEAIESLAFAPDGSTLATIGQSGLHLWDTQKSTQLWSSAPGQFAGKPLGIAFAPDGGQIVTCGMDGMVRLWAVERGPSLRLTGTLFTVSTYINAPSTYLKVTPDGYFGGSKDAEHYIRWQTGSQLWPAEKFSAQFNRPDLVQQTFAGQRIPAMGTG